MSMNGSSRADHGIGAPAGHRRPRTATAPQDVLLRSHQGADPAGVVLLLSTSQQKTDDPVDDVGRGAPRPTAGQVVGGDPRRAGGHPPDPQHHLRALEGLQPVLAEEGLRRLGAADEQDEAVHAGSACSDWSSGWCSSSWSAWCSRGSGASGPCRPSPRRRRGSSATSSSTRPWACRSVLTIALSTLGGWSTSCSSSASSSSAASRRSSRARSRPASRHLGPGPRRAPGARRTSTSSRSRRRSRQRAATCRAASCCGVRPAPARR